MPDNSSTHEVVVYHDETQFLNRGYKGHVLLFVPVRISGTQTTPLFGTEQYEYCPHQLLFQAVMQTRHEYSLDRKLHFTNISGKQWTRDDLGTRIIISKAVDALRHKTPAFHARPLKCKLAAIFYPAHADYAIYGSALRDEQRLRHDETLLRMLLKGASHYLYDDLGQVLINKIVSDGQPYRRPLEDDRIIWRLTRDESYGRTPLRDYVKFCPDAEILHLISDHKAYPAGSDSYVHANFLQLADLLLGATIRACYVGCSTWPSVPRLGGRNAPKKDVIAYPLKEMLDKVHRRAGFQNSGHYKSFTLSQVEFFNGEINFKDVRPLQSLPKDPKVTQPRFLIFG